MIPRRRNVLGTFLATATAIVSALPAGPLGAQPLFKSVVPVELTLTTNLRDLMRERDSTALRWFGTELEHRDEAGNVHKIPTELRARGHFRRQARNCAFPPLSLRANREARDSSLLQGNPRLKLVTPCRPSGAEFQQYILLEYMVYRTYAVLSPVHHRTRLAKITYRDSTERVKPIAVTAFILEIEEEVADANELVFTEEKGALWVDVNAEVLGRLSLFEYWIGNTDWSMAGLHNISLFQSKSGDLVPVAYDFDWSGAVNARYSFPNPTLGIRSVRDRLHRGPCWTAEQWAPVIAHYTSKRAEIDSVWAESAPGLDAKRRDEVKAWLDSFWPVLTDARRFKREILDQCQKLGN